MTAMTMAQKLKELLRMTVISSYIFFFCFWGLLSTLVENFEDLKISSNWIYYSQLFPELFHLRLQSAGCPRFCLSLLHRFWLSGIFLLIFIFISFFLFWKYNDCLAQWLRGTIFVIFCLRASLTLLAVCKGKIDRDLCWKVSCMISLVIECTTKLTENYPSPG